MNYRKFGRMGWMVSELGYGMWGMAGWTGSSDDESKQALQRSVELGCNFFDTAWAYGEGHSEALLVWLVRNNPGKNSIPPQKSLPRISSGLAGVNTLWMIAFHLITSRITFTEA